MIREFNSTTIGTDQAPFIPPGATLTSAAWHVALFYGPSLPYATEREAIVAAIDVADEAAAARPGFAPSITIDLRWNMVWDQGALDANGRATHAKGVGFTVFRRTYLSPDDARRHLANMDALYPGGDLPPVRDGWRFHE